MSNRFPLYVDGPFGTSTGGIPRAIGVCVSVPVWSCCELLSAEGMDLVRTYVITTVKAGGRVVDSDVCRWYVLLEVLHWPVRVRVQNTLSVSFHQADGTFIQRPIQEPCKPTKYHIVRSQKN